MLGGVNDGLAQDSRPSGNAIGLPPASKLMGTPRRASDGTIIIDPPMAIPQPNQFPTIAKSPTSQSKAQAVSPPLVLQPGPAAHGAAMVGTPDKLRATVKTVISQIHNAPGWQHSHTYTYHPAPYTRVVNGPGWNEALGVFTPGQTLRAYQLTSSSDCTSGPGGGPVGTDDAISDGTCKWKYLSQVDYISITAWAFDNVPWRARTYNFGDYVVSDSPLRSYQLQNAAGCDSTIGPIGGGERMGATITMKDGCQWRYWASITYTSGVSHIPTQTYPDNEVGKATRHMVANYQANLWNDREYVAGQNDENAPIALQAHLDYTLDGFPYDSESGGGINPTDNYRMIVAAAPGESFRDTTTAAMPFVGYDPTKGVAIHSMANSNYAAGIELRDNCIDLIGLQIKSDYGPGVAGGETHGGNAVSVQNSIIDGGAAANTAAVQLDTSPLVVNSLIIARGTFGVFEAYPGIVLHSTLVNPGQVPNSVGVLSGIPWVFNPPVVSNSAIFGFAHAVAAINTEKVVWGGDNNVTDAPAGDSAAGNWPFGNSETSATTLPGTAYGTPIQNTFVAFPGDYRPGAASRLKGTGAAYGPFTSHCEAKIPNCAPSDNFDSPDIIGTSRPQDGRYDVGAWQSPSTFSKH